MQLLMTSLFHIRAWRRSIRWHAAVCVALVGCAAVSGCAFGPRVLKANQLDYGRALGDAKKREILSAVVGLRYADAPGFLDVTQIIAAYNFDTTATVQAGSGNLVTGVAGYSDHPTFTFTPTTGQSYAKTYLRPLSPAQLLPLAQSGVPIDLLLRIAAQSIGRFSNATMLGGNDGNGTPEFFELLRLFRQLQLSGAVSIAFKPPGSEQIVVMFASPNDLSADALVAMRRIRDLLHLSEDSEFTVVTGPGNDTHHSIEIVTRSLLGILSSLSAEIKVPAADVVSGATKAPIDLVGGETRPVLQIHSGKVPRDVYATIRYRSQNFWIANEDFDSKYALTVVQSIAAVAEATDTTKAPLLTVPAR